MSKIGALSLAFPLSLALSFSLISSFILSFISSLEITVPAWLNQENQSEDRTEVDIKKEFDGATFRVFTIDGKEGSVLPDGTFSVKAKGVPGVWIAEAIKSKVSLLNGGGKHFWLFLFVGERPHPPFLTLLHHTCDSTG